VWAVTRFLEGVGGVHQPIFSKLVDIVGPRLHHRDALEPIFRTMRVRPTHGVPFLVGPYLLAIAMASNIGSTATITGNPQNMIISGLSHIPYGAFTAALWPVAAVGPRPCSAALVLMYHHGFFIRDHFPSVVAGSVRYHGPLVVKSALVTAAMVILFFAGQPVAKVAIVGGALLLFTRPVKAEKVRSTGLCC
jgi:Na+/H+ antiporter NhaD/arsenite permease-like protein